MNLATKIHIACYSLLVVLLTAIIAFSVKEHIAQRIAEVEADAEKKIAEAAQQRIDERDKLLTKQTGAITDDKKQTQTPQQVVVEIPKYIEVPKPIYLEQPKDASGKEIPNAPPVAVVPNESIKPLFDQLASCKADDLSLSACRADLKDETSKTDAAKREAAIWKNLSEGGTRWERLRKAGKVTLCAGAGAGIGALAGGKKPAPWAAVGALIGTAGCSIF